jgi:hypothetical protein
VESIPTLTSLSPFAGRPVNGGLDRPAAGRESPALLSPRVGDHGCSGSFREGELLTTSRAASHARRGEVPSLWAVWPTPLIATGSRSVALATGGGTVASPASDATSTVVFGALTSASLQPPKVLRRWSACGSLLAQLSKLRCRMPCSSKDGHGKREQTHQKSGPMRAGTEAGEDRSVEGCARASLSLVAEIDRRRRTQRCVRSPLHPIWGLHADGGSSLR